MYKNLLTKLNNGENLSQDESKAFIDLVFEGVIPTEILTESLILLNKNVHIKFLFLTPYYGVNKIITDE